MDSLTVGLAVFGCVFGGVLVGMLIRVLLPEQHFTSESKDVVKLGTGLIGTMAALVLGLLVGSAKASYDSQKDEVTQLSADVVLMDRILAHYGPDAKPARELLHQTVTAAIARFWRGDLEFAPPASNTAPSGDMLFDELHKLSPPSESQKKLQEEVLSLLGEASHTRVLLAEQQVGSIAFPLLVILVSWLTIIFMSFGLFAPRNATVMVTLIICAMSVAGAIFLILELDRPFTGLIQISSAPMRNALSALGH